MNRILRQMLAAFLLLAAASTPGLAQVLVQDPILVNPTCPGDQNGSITFRLPSDSTDYLFDWSGGNAQTGLTNGLYRQQGLQGATYTVYILNIISLEDTTISLTLNQPPQLLVSAGQDVRTCVGQTVRLSGSASTTGNFVWSYTDGTGTPRTLTGATVNIPGSGAGSLNVNTTTTVALRVTTAAGCFSDDTLLIRTNPIPVASFSFSKTAICVGSTVDVTFTGSATAEAVYSWILVSGGGVFTSNGLTTITGPGPHQIRFDQAGTGTPPLRSVLLRVTEPTSGGGSACQANRSGTITVQAPPALSVSGLSAKYCVTAPAVTLLPSPSGGTFRGPGIVGYSFSPSVAGIGTHSIVYRFTTALGCSDSITLTTSVYGLPTAVITGLDTAYCRGTAGINLGLSPTGGTLLGSGTRAPDLFYPDSATLGTITIRYAVVDTNGCTDTATTQTKVKPTPSVTVTPDSSGICSGGTTAISLSSSTPGVSFDYVALATGVSGSVSASGNSIAQTLTGAGQVLYIGTASFNGCTSRPDTALVTVTGRPVATATPPSQTLCSGVQGQIVFGSAQPNVTYAYTVAAASAGITGAVSGTGDTLRPTLVNTGSTAGEVRYLITPSALGCDGDTFSVRFTVQPQPSINVVQADTLLCSGDSVRIQLSSPVLGVSFTFVPTLIQGTASGFAPFVGPRLAQELVNGDTTTAIIAYQIVPAVGGCTGPARTIRAQLSPRPVMRNLPDSLRICSGTTFTQALRSTPAGAAFAWSTFPVSGSITGSGTGSGTTLTGNLTGNGVTGYRIVPTNGTCTGTADTLYVRTNQKPVLSFTPATPVVCSGEITNIALSSDEPTATIFWRKVNNANVTGARGGSGTTIADTLVNTSASVQNQVYRVWAQAGGCVADTITITVQVRQKLVLTASPTTANPCSGDSVRIRLFANPAAGATFAWQMHAAGNVSGLISGMGNRIAFAPVNNDSTPAVVTIRAVAQGSCTSDSLTITIGVRVRPQILTTSPAPICSGDTVKIAVRTIPRNASLSYTISDSLGVHGLIGGTVRQIRQRVTGSGSYTFNFSSTLVGCPATATVTGTVNPLPTPPSIAASGSLVLCPGASVTLSTTSTDALQWLRNDTAIAAPAGTAASLVVTRAGVYKLTATTATGCGSNSSSVTVTESPAPAQPVVSGDSGFCPSGTAVLTSTAANTYQWLLEGAPISGQTAQSLSAIATAGNYQVIAFNAAGCSDTSAVFAIIARSNPAAPVVTGPTQICPGDTLVLRSSVSGGLQWLSGGSALAGQTADTLRIGAAGTYAVRLTDRFGCSSVSADFTVNNGPVPTKPVITGTALLCPSDTAILTSSISDPSYHTQWLRNDTLLTDTTVSIRTPKVGLYTVRVFQTGSCTATSDTFRVSPAAAPATPTITGLASFCTGSSTTLTASVAASYAWLRNDTLIAGANAQTLTVTRPGIYTIQVGNAAGCKALSAPDTVSEIAVPTLAAATTPTSSCGVADGTITLTVTGGSGRFGYLWTGTGVNATAQNQTAVRGGTYSVAVTDSATNCVVNLSGIIVQDTALFAASATVANATTCNSNSGSITLTIDASKGPFDFAWTGTGTGITAGVQDQPALSAGTYQVVITQTATGCQRTLTGLQINAPTPVKPTISGRLSLCSGGSTVLRSSATANNRWFFNNSRIAGATSDTLIVTQVGSYFVVDSSNGCAASSDTVTIINSVPPVAPTLAGDTTYCTGTSGSLTASSPVNLWLIDGIPTILSGQTIATSAFGAYQAVVIDANGCSDTSAAFVTRPIRYNPIVAKQDPTSCGTTDGRARVTYTSALPVTVVWKNDLGTVIASGADTVAGLAPGLYKVLVQTSSCADSADFLIAVPAGFSVSATATQSNCGNADGSASASVTGGSNPAIVWYRVNGTGGLDSLTSGTTASALAAGSYAVIAKEGVCRDTAFVSVTDTLRRTVSVLRTADACGVRLGLARISSPSILNSIVWKDAGNNILSSNDSLVAGAGSYTVVFSAGACKDSAQAVIGTGATPRVTASSTPASTCTGSDGTATADFGPGASYAWFRTEGGTRTPVGVTASINGLAFGAYRVVATQGTCIDSADVNVGRPSNCGAACGIRLTVASNPVTCLGGGNGEVIALITSGASGSYQFRLNGVGGWIASDSVYRRFVGLPAGSYSVEVRDRLDTACTTSASQTIGTRITLSVLAQVDNGSCGTVAGSIRVRVAGGSAPYRVSLDSARTFVTVQNAFGDTTFNNLPAATYQLVVEDATPCRTAAQAITVQPRARIRPFLTAVPVRCAGSHTGGFRVDTVLGGSGSYTYRVNGNTVATALLFDTTYTGFAAGNNTVFITDAASGCTWDTTLVLAEPVRLTATTAILQQPTCGQANGSIRITSVTGGTAPYRLTLLLNGTVLNGPAPLGDSLRNVLAEGLYTLRIQDTLGCADSVSFRLSATPLPVVVAVTPGTVRVCPGQEVIFRSSVNASVPNPLYQWWVNSTPIAGATVDTLAISTLQPGDTVRLELRSTSAPACLTGLPALSNRVLVDVVSGLIAADVRLTPDSVVSCPGTPITLKALNLNHIAGVRYDFYLNDTLRQQGADSSYTVAVPRDQDRVFVVLTAPASASCVQPGVDTSLTVKLQIKASIVATATVSGTDTVGCQGSPIVLRVQSNLSSVPGYTVQWLRNGVPVTGATGTTYAVTDAAGIYRYRAIVNLNAAGTCITGLPDTSAVYTVHVRASSDPLCRPCQLRLAVDTVIGTNCAPQATGQIRVVASSGSGRYSYGQLVNDTVRTYQASPLFTALRVGSYGFVVRDSANPACTDTLRAVVVPTRTNLNATIVVTRLTACSGTPNGRIEISSVTGGFGRYRYKIRRGDTLSTQNVYTNLPAGFYPITVHDDSTGCEFLTLARVDTAPPLQAFAHVVRNVSCYGGSDAVIRIDSVRNGTGGYMYSITRPDTGYVAFVPGSTLLQGFNVGPKIIYVRDGGRCIATLNLTVRQPDSLKLAIGSIGRSDCASPTGTVRITEHGGGSGPHIYTLLRPGATRPDTVNFPFADSTLRTLEGGDYVLTVRDSLGCSRTVAFRVPSDAPQAAAIQVIGNCPGGANGVIRLTGLSGGRKPYTFELTRADGFIRTQTDSVFTQLVPGVYSITITDSSLPACKARYTRTLSVLDTLKATVLSFRPSTCNALDGEAVILISGGYKGYRFSYDSVAGSFTPYHTLVGDTLRLTGLTARPEGVLHQLRLLDSAPEGGCTGTFSWQQPGNTPLTFNLAATDVLCNGDRSGTLLLGDVKGTGPIRISAFDASSGALIKTDSLRDGYFRGSQFTITGLPAGSYNVQIAQYGTCDGSRTETVTITQPTRIEAHYRNTHASSPDFAEGEIELDSVTGGVKPYQIRIGADGVWQSYTPGIYLDRQLPGTIQLFVADSNGCQVVRDLVVERDTVLGSPNVFTPNNDGVNDTWVIKNLPAGSRVTVHNRWGRKVLDADPYDNKWDGEDLPAGIYLYEIIPPSGDPIRGWVEIIRSEGR